MKPSHLTILVLAVGLGLAGCGAAPKQGALDDNVDPTAAGGGSRGDF